MNKLAKAVIAFLLWIVVVLSTIIAGYQTRPENQSWKCTRWRDVKTVAPDSGEEDTLRVCIERTYTGVMPK